MFQLHDFYERECGPAKEILKKSEGSNRNEMHLLKFINVYIISQTCVLKDKLP